MTTVVVCKSCGRELERYGNAETLLVSAGLFALLE